MENISQYIDVLVQAPIAVILIVFIYLTNKQQTLLINKLAALLEAQSKIIKQQERK